VPQKQARARSCVWSRLRPSFTLSDGTTVPLAQASGLPNKPEHLCRLVCTALLTEAVSFDKWCNDDLLGHPALLDTPFAPNGVFGAAMATVFETMQGEQDEDYGASADEMDESGDSSDSSDSSDESDEEAGDTRKRKAASGQRVVKRARTC